MASATFVPTYRPVPLPGARLLGLEVADEFEVGGRWTSPGRPVVYVAGNLSLAMVELLVRVDAENLRTLSYVYRRVRFSEEALAVLDLGSLLEDWRARPESRSTRVIGDAWLERAETPVRDLVWDPRLDVECRNVTAGGSRVAEVGERDLREPVGGHRKVVRRPEEGLVEADQRGVRSFGAGQVERIEGAHWRPGPGERRSPRGWPSARRVHPIAPSVRAQTRIRRGSPG